MLHGYPQPDVYTAAFYFSIRLTSYTIHKPTGIVMVVSTVAVRQCTVSNVYFVAWVRLVGEANSQVLKTLIALLIVYSPIRDQFSGVGQRNTPLEF